VALTLLTVILESVQVCITHTHNRAIIVTLLWSEIMGGYNTPDTMVEIGA